jgi:RecB family exonuclease
MAARILAIMLLLTTLCSRSSNSLLVALPRRSSGLTLTLTASSSRLFSTVEKAAASQSAASGHAEPNTEFTTLSFNGIESMPTGSMAFPANYKLPKIAALSPSSALEFKACPQSFLLRYVLKLQEPSTSILCKGTMVHTALERIFDYPKEERTRALLHNLLREAWSEEKFNGKGTYDHLFDSIEEEREWGQQAIKLLDNYLELENPQNLDAEPLRREMWVRGSLPLDAGGGGDDDETFMVRGIVDRLDLVRDEDAAEGVLCITDYKTGKAPFLKYNEVTNQRIVNEKFWQLKVYAVLLRAMERAKEAGKQAKESENDAAMAPPGIQLRKLKLMFLTSETGEAQALEYDLGDTEEERAEEIDGVEQELKDIWLAVQEMIKSNDPTAFGHCKRSFCGCHRAREVFVDGSLACQ